MYDIFCIPAGLLRFRAPLVTQPEKIRSIIRVDRAVWKSKLLNNLNSRSGTGNDFYFTMIVVPCKIILIDEKVMITIQFPEFAINNVKVFITEIGHDLIDILFLFKQLKNLLIIVTSRSVTHVFNRFLFSMTNKLPATNSIASIPV